MLPMSGSPLKTDPPLHKHVTHVHRFSLTTYRAAPPPPPIPKNIPILDRLLKWIIRSLSVGLFGIAACITLHLHSWSSTFSKCHY
ncbi:hypothetical protein CEXT_349501 [Caerostris extrusa]|uniref:Uncharacterized protein n=1 Tax=Caerostris extrusa TaxID=172846 RepID=A0AAV4VC05_CAEEX|nr:hypothetical protein CEXT_349501 [Caerostris extrusa]